MGVGGAEGGVPVDAGKQDGAPADQMRDTSATPDVPAADGAEPPNGVVDSAVEGGEGGDTALDASSTSDAALDVPATMTACLDGASRSCKDDPDLGALGNCGGGVELCAAGHWGACSITPAGKDSCALLGDDATCNGQANEGCPCVDGSQQACGPAADVGKCRRGTQTCAAGTWGACMGAVYSASRDCTSAADNNCDGMPDNTPDAVCVCAAMTTRPCDEHAGKDGKGRCKAGAQTCVVATDHKTSSWGTCTGSVGPAAADACSTGNDDNCNGMANEGCTCVEGNKQPCGPTAEVGICKKGSQTCTGGAWGACAGAVFAAARDCTSMLDNDCDGHPDNAIDAVCACASGTQACGQHAGQDGKGRCKAGSQSCVVAADKKSSAWGTCSGSVGPASADGCDATNDDNCNGVPHEGCSCVNGTTRACGPSAIGICKPSTQTCVNASWPTTCPGAVTAKARDCTSTADNDCSGLPDNQDSTCACPAGMSGAACPGNNTGSCTAGTRNCNLSADKSSTSWGSCTGMVLPAASDTCVPGNDANCNGKQNEGCDCTTATMPKACECGGTQKCKSDNSGKFDSCVTACSSTQTCSGGQCVCKMGLTVCNGACVDTLSDPKNCGGCAGFAGRNCADSGLVGCSAGLCTCPTNKIGAICFLPGEDNRGTCYKGKCLLPAHFPGCSSPADCVDGGCSGGFCLGTISDGSQVTCTDNSGLSAICPASQGCSSGSGRPPVFCGGASSGTGDITCDGPGDCPAGNDCCALAGAQHCYAQPSGGGLGAGCTALNTNPNAPQAALVCNPSSSASCPSGKTCVNIYAGAAFQAYFQCQ